MAIPRYIWNNEDGQQASDQWPAGVERVWDSQNHAMADRQGNFYDIEGNLFNPNEGDPRQSDWFKRAVDLQQKYGTSAFGEMWKNGQFSTPNQAAANTLSDWLQQQQYRESGGDNPMKDPIFVAGLGVVTGGMAAAAVPAAYAGTAAGAAAGGARAAGNSEGLGGILKGAAIGGATGAAGQSVGGMYSGTETLDPSGLNAADTKGLINPGATSVAGATSGLGSTVGTGGEVTNGVSNLPTAPAGVPGAIQMGATGTGNLGGNLGVDQFGNVTGGVGAGGAVGGTGSLGGVGGTAATGLGGLTLQKLLSGDLSADDLAKSITVGDVGKLLGTGASIYGDQQRAGAFKDIYNDMAAKRQPFLDKATGWLNDPNSYAMGPGKTTLDAVLRQLSVNGNPANNPTSLGIATQAGLTDWRNAVTGFGNIGLSGEDTRANVMGNSIDATGKIYSDLGRGISSITNPPTTLEQALRTVKGLV